MQYKTIVLHLLEQQPQTHEHLKRTRMMMKALGRYGVLLRDSHEAWKVHLSQQSPNSEPSQLASEALELALKELQNQLEIDFPQTTAGSLNLDDAMRFIRRHTPPA